MSIALLLLMSFVQLDVQEPNKYDKPSTTFGQGVLQQELAPPITVKEEMVGRDGLRRGILKAATKARSEGLITRRDMIKLRLGTLAPAVLEKIEDVAVMQMAASGEELGGVVPMSEDGKIERANIDWDKLLEFLERLLPIILQIITIFAGAMVLNMSSTGPSTKNAVRVLNQNSCGSGSICGVDNGGTYILTNAHVAGTRVGREVKVDLQIGGKKTIKARVIMAAYSDKTQTDWAVLYCDGYDCRTDGITPVKLSKAKPSVNKSYYTMGSPRCVWPLVNTDISPVDMQPNMPLWRWRPNAIGGQSGSGVWSDADNLQYGLLTWSWGGLGAGQQTAEIYKQALNQNTIGLPRVEGLVEISIDNVPVAERGDDDPVVESGLFAQTGFTDLPIWFDATEPPAPNPDPDKPCSPDSKLFMIEYLRDVAELYDNKRKQLEDGSPTNPAPEPGNPEDPEGPCDDGRVFGLPDLS